MQRIFPRRLFVTACLAATIVGGAWMGVRAQTANAPALPPLQTTKQAVSIIPININPKTKAIEVQLHVTEDGANWRQVDSVKPQMGQVTFRAPHDGEYWLAVRTRFASGDVLPKGPFAPEMRIMVDSLSPEIQLQATRGTGGEISVRYRIADRGIVPATLRLEYKAAASADAIPVNTAPLRPDAMKEFWTGEAIFNPSLSPNETVVVRAQIADDAGNVADQTTQVAPVAAAAPHGMIAKTTPRRETWNANNDAAMLAGKDTRQSPLPSPFESNQNGNGRDPEPYRLAGARNDGGARAFPAPGGSVQTEEIPAPMGEPRGETREWGETIAPGPDFGGPQMVPASTEQLQTQTVNESVGPARETFSSSPQTPPTGARPRMVNSRHFALEYELESVGPSGVSRIELWGTQDNGITWRSFAVDSDNRSPISVNVEGEGLYGFTMVVETGSGLRGVAPQSGEAPEIWIGVDLSKPRAQLVTAEQGQGEQLGEVTIRWEASDNQLAVRPISLYYSEAAEGPWNIVAAGLPNAGRFNWRLDRRVPESIYLKLEARDDAGNVTEDISGQPILLDRVVPQGRISGVRPVEDSARVPSRVTNLR